MNALEIKNLSKSYSDFHLDCLTFSLPSGCILGLIGENGAGKSTTIKLILDMIRRDSGSVTLLGRDNRDNLCLTKEDIGVVLDEPGFSGCLNAVQIGRILRYTFRGWQDDVYRAYLKKLDIPTGKPFKDFSRGMKKKLEIAAALSHQAKLLLLDEPTSGLDPVVRDEVVTLFSEFTRDERHSILISSHITSDLEKLCDYIAFLHKGKLLLFEEKDALTAQYGIIRCTAAELGRIDGSAIIGKKESPYGVEAIVRRSEIPGAMAASPVGLEELFIFMVKEAN